MGSNVTGNTGLPPAATVPTETEETTTESATSPSWKLGCKVPDHNGPLAEGWEANRKYRESIDPSRRTNVLTPDGELDANQFGKWTSFARCLKDVMLLLEGQAYFKETEKIEGKHAHIDTNKQSIMDDGSKEGQEVSNDEILAGSEIGSSKYASENSKEIWLRIIKYGDKKEKNKKKKIHGAGLRYNEKKDGSDALIKKCEMYLPSNEPAI